MLPIVDQTRATAAIANFNKKNVIPIFLRIYAAKAASTIGKMQYPRTQTHWKKDIFPPSSFVLMVTMKDPPHITKKMIPNYPPFELIPKLRILFKSIGTMREVGKEVKVPIDPLY